MDRRLTMLSFITVFTFIWIITSPIWGIVLIVKMIKRFGRKNRWEREYEKGQKIQLKRMMKNSGMETMDDALQQLKIYDKRLERTERRKKKRGFFFYFTLFTVCLSLLVSWSQNHQKNSTKTEISTNTVSESKVQLLRQSSEVKGNLLYATGQIKNNTDHTLSYVAIDTKEYDHNGNVVGNGFDMIRNLNSGEVWTYEILISKEVAQYRIVKIKAY